jgi:four helix bundle protein
MSNIAEGYGRKSDKDFAHFLDIARSSALEVQSILYVALDLEYIQEKEFNKLYNMANESVSMIAGFSSYLRQNKQNSISESGVQTPDSRLLNET